MRLEGWGRFPRHESEILLPSVPDMVSGFLAGREGVIARGNGRGYGDAAIGKTASVASARLDRMKAFDPQTRLLTVEAGVLLSDIIDAFLPRGFFPPVVPGTKFVTVGGMIAADVHGKNHHRDGGFGRYVENFTLVLPDGETVSCSPSENTELFFATIGGMGLTGIITEATIRMRAVPSGWIVQHTFPAGSLAEALSLLKTTADATYSVAWIDCLAQGASLGRSLIYTGEHARQDEVRSGSARRAMMPAGRGRGLAVPLDLPSGLLNRHSVRAFNQLYFLKGRRQAGAPMLVHWDTYFFPLDGIAQWNRLYGRKGFLQHQCVVPAAAAQDVFGQMLERVARSGRASFLAVLKTLGPAGGMLSFPMEGYTLALDIPLSDDALLLLDELDRIVVAGGGRLYLAKDARQSRTTFAAGYPRLEEFRQFRRNIGAERHLVSRLSDRLGI